MTINNGNGKNIVIGILIAALLIMNLVIPFIKQQNTNKELAQAKSLMTQLNSTKDAKSKQAIGERVLALNQKPLALSASADIKGSLGASSTTSQCNMLYQAAIGSLDLGAVAAYRAIFQLYFENCLQGSVVDALTR